MQAPSTPNRCEQVQALLLTLPYGEFYSVTEHTATCSACAGLLSTLQEAHAALAQDLDAFAHDGDFDDAFKRALAAAGPPPSAWWLWSALSFRVPMIATALAVVALFALVVRGGWTTDRDVLPVIRTVTPAAPPETAPLAVPTTPPTDTPAPIRRPQNKAPEPTTAPAPTAADLDCLEGLDDHEAMAALGRLKDEAIACLESGLQSAPAAQKTRISSMLMVNAWAKGDKLEWERLATRHTDEIDPADPDVPYKLALALSRGGPPQAALTARYANRALALRVAWKGDLHTKRVASLHKVVALAHLQLLQQAKGTSEEPAARDAAWTAARDWYDNASASGAQTADAEALCQAALAKPCR